MLVGLTIVALRPDLVLGGYAGRPWSMGERLLTQAIVFWNYIGLIVVPLPSHMGLYHEVPTYGASDWLAWAAVAGIGALLAVAFGLRRRCVIFTWSVLWFIASHLMESTVLPLEMIYEHRNYTGLIGFTALAAWSLGNLDFLGERLFSRVWLIPVALLSSLTFSRAVDWSSTEHFYAAEYRHHPHSFRALLGFYDTIDRSGAFPDVAEYLESEIVRRRGAQPWVPLMIATKQCNDASYLADWDTVKRTIRNAKQLGRFSDYAQSVLDQIIRGGCPDLDRNQFGEVLEQLYRRAYYADDHTNAELAASLRGWLYRVDSEWESARLWYWKASKTSPRSFEPLFELSYMDLNLGNDQEVERAVDELRYRARRFRLPIAYRIQEIDIFLGLMRRDKNETNR